MILAYAGSVGFVAAGIASSFYKLITSEPARFGPQGPGALALLSAFIFGALTGPVIVVEKALSTRRTDRIPLGWVAAGIFCAGLWSCCSGVVVLQLVLAIRHTLA